MLSHTNPHTPIYRSATERGPIRPGSRHWKAQEIRATRAAEADEYRNTQHYRDDADARRAIWDMTDAMLRCSESWIAGGFSPDARDVTWAMLRAIGIGTAHGDVSEELVDDVDMAMQYGAGAVEAAVYLYGRIHG